MQNAAEVAVKELQEILPQALHEALQQEAVDYCQQILKGVTYYLEAPVALKKAKKQIIWSEGSSSMLSYADNNALAQSHNIVLFVPSLINRSYIFDLQEKVSFLEFLGQQGIPCALLDWGEPGQDEAGFYIDHYIERLDRAIASASHLAGKPVMLAGYCMGGMMALASCQRHPENIAGLALFATPWNFHAQDVTRFNLTDTHVQNMEKQILSQPTLPKEWMQMVFYLLYSQHIHRKYQTLAQLDPLSEEVQELLAIEYWANDGIKITSGAAKNCLVDWAYHNTPMQGKWRVKGEVIIPERIACPTLVAIARHDRIASYHSALPLAEKIKGSALLTMDAGHVGMIAGRHAKKVLWEPFVTWLSQV